MKLPIFNTTKRPTPAEHHSRNDTTVTGFDSSELNPASAAASETGENTLNSLRPRILDRLLWVAVLLGALVFALQLPRLLDRPLSVPTLIRSPYSIGLLLYSLLWLALIVAAIHRQMTFTRRAALLFLALFTTGLALLLSYGLSGSGQVVLLTIPFLVAIISRGRGRITGLALSLGTLILTAILFWTGVIPPTGLLAGTAGNSVLYWFVVILVFALLAIGGVNALVLLVDGAQSSLARQHDQIGQLESKLTQAEAQVAERSDDLHRRLIQIRTVAEINRAVSRMLDIDQLLPEVCELVRQRFNLYYVGIFLVEQVGQRELLHSDTDQNLLPGGDEDWVTAQAPATTNYAILKAGTGEAGRIMLSEGHKLSVGGDSMIGWATANRQPRIALTVGQENSVNIIGRFDNPHLPLTRSELALPILAGETQNQDDSGQDYRLLGAMTIQSSQEQAFDQDDIVILQGIADGLASAIENARLFQATQASLEEIRTLHRQYLEQAWQTETAQRGEIAYTYEDKSILSPSPAFESRNWRERRGWACPFRVAIGIANPLARSGDRQPDVRPQP